MGSNPTPRASSLVRKTIIAQRPPLQWGSASKFLVAGGGICGLFLTYYLLEAGHEVVVADTATGPVRTSAYNAGQISSRPSFTDIFRRSRVVRISPAERRRHERWLRLARNHGSERYEEIAVPLATRSMAMYDDFLSSERPGVDLIEEVLELRSKARGGRDPQPEGRLLSEREVSELGYKGFAEGWLTRERSLHSGKLVDFLRRTVVENGARVASGRVSLKRSGHGVSHALVGARRVLADAYVVAAGSWSREVCAPLGYDPMVIPARGLALFYRTRDGPAVGCPAVYEDEGLTVTQHDGQTLRLTSFFELVGFDARVGRARRRWLLDAAASRFSRPRRLDLIEAGVGFRPSTPDQLPVVGRIPRCDNGYVLTGACRKGITLAPVLASLTMQCALGDGEAADVLLHALRPGRFERRGSAGEVSRKRRDLPRF